jgi:midasin
VGDVPTDELQDILIQKCSLPASRASLMVKVMENLQIFRSQANLFSGKNSIITVRDLLKWAGRINSNQDGSHVTPENIALEGFLLLAERSRNATDKAFIKETIEKAFGVKIDEDQFYTRYFDSHLRSVF